MSFELDAAFERALIESARDDAHPRDVQQEWARFAAALALAVPPAASVPPTMVAPATLSGAVRWLLLGAIASGGFAAGLLVERHAARRDPAPSAVEAAPAGRSPVRSPAVTPEAPAAPAAGQARPPRRKSRAAHPPAPVSLSAPPTLAAEVSRIDTARTVSAVGDYDQALRLVERYHRDFPQGLLAPDADVVALEAAAAKHDGADVARRAALFLARYPDDPHAARVRQLQLIESPSSR
jgi:hypothetical protein